MNADGKLARYHRQMLLRGIGEAGQRRLSAAHVLIVGCGALGSVIADTLARAGVGRLRLVDRDVVELTNLQRQVLFDESDVHQALPEAQAARARIAQTNSQVQVEACVDDFSHRNAERLGEDVDVLVDGLDNFEARYLLNDLAVARHLPYVYGGAVGVSGMSMTFLPHAARAAPAPAAAARPRSVTWTDAQATPCLRCIFPEAPPPGSTPTCDTAGVLAPAVLTIAAHQAAQTLKLLTGNIDALDRSLLSIDLWSNETRRFDVSASRHPDCPCCGQGRFEYLNGQASVSATTLCGRNAVQIAAADSCTLDLGGLAERLAPHGHFTSNEYLLQGSFFNERSPEGEPIRLTLFPDGRAIIVGTSEPEAARAIYARFIGA